MPYPLATLMLLCATPPAGGMHLHEQLLTIPSPDELDLSPDEWKATSKFQKDCERRSGAFAGGAKASLFLWRRRAPSFRRAPKLKPIPFVRPHQNDMGCLNEGRAACGSQNACSLAWEQRLPLSSGRKRPARANRGLSSAQELRSSYVIERRRKTGLKMGPERRGKAEVFS